MAISALDEQERRRITSAEAMAVLANYSHDINVVTEGGDKVLSPPSKRMPRAFALIFMRWLSAQAKNDFL